MGYFINNRKVRFSDLEASGIYSDKVMDEVKKGNYHELTKILDVDTRKNKDYMEPLMYAVKNEKGTYAIYEYYHENLQDDRVLATEIIRKEPQLIKNTPLSRQRDFILQAAEITPEVIVHMSQELKQDSQFIGVLCKLQNEEVKQYAAIECEVPDVFLENPELTGNAIFMMQTILQDVNSLEYMSEELKNDYKFMRDVSRNTEVIDYVVEHTEQFGKEGLNATKDALVEVSVDETIHGFEEEGKRITEQIAQAENGDNKEGLDELLKRNKQLERHIKFFERIQKGEIDPIRAVKLIDKLCHDIEPEYKQKIYQIMKLDEAIIERDKEYEKAKKMLGSAIKATEDGITTGQINEEVEKISEIQRSRDNSKEVETSALE